jgi:hypothetical protein
MATASNSNDINLLITNSNVFIVELIVSLNLNVQLEMLFAICAIKLAIFQGLLLEFLTVMMQILIFEINFR